MLRQCKALLPAVLFLLLYPSIGVSGDTRRGWSKALIWPANSGERVSPDYVAVLGVEHVREYESFTLVRVPTASAARVAADARKLSYRFEIQEDWDRVFMPGGGVVDARSPALPAQRIPETYPNGEGLYVVQFDGPLTADTEKELSDNKLTCVGYLPYNSVIVFGNHGDVVRLAAAPQVQWSSVYHPAFRAHPEKLPPADEMHRFLIQLVDTPGNEATWARLRAANVGREETNAYLSYRNVWIEASSALIPMLLADPYVVGVEYPGVAAISGEREAIAATSLAVSSTGPYQNGVRPYKPAGDYRTWLSERGVLDTSAYRIAFADVGLPAYHQDITNGRNIGYQTYVGGSVYDQYGHGTAVAGLALGDSVAGSTEPPPAPTPPPAVPFFWGMGLAPKTMAFSQKIGNGGIDYENEMTLANDAYNWGCTVQTHSWNEYLPDGSNSGKYTQKAQEFDVAVHDTYGQAPVTPMPVTVSAGNKDGGCCPPDPSTGVVSPATAKNVLAVGASESWRPGLSGCEADVADSLNNVALVSRRGTLDGRYKPDIIAPGTLISSTRLSGKTSCFAPPAEYLIYSGTSYAAPQAAAAYVLLSKKRGVSLSPAMLKAAVIGNSLSVKGGSDRLTGLTVAARPNAVQGFGRLYLGDALATSGVTQTYLDENSWTPFTGSGQTRSRTFTVANSSKPTVIVVAWTDHAAAFPCSICLSRDIDLWIQSGSWYYTGNKMTTSEVSQQQTTPAWDSRNNVEMIVIPPNTLSLFTLNLTTRTYSIGWPSWRDQPFAVFASNAY